MTLAALLGVVTRWSLFAAVLVMTGAAAFRFLVLGRLAAVGDETGRRLAHRAASLGAAAALLALVAALARLPLQLIELRDPEMPLGPQLHALVWQTSWGRVWLVQLATAAVAVAGFRGARGDNRSARLIAALAALVLTCTPALSGHAIGSERLPGLAVIADSLHVLGASLWLGAMVLLAAGLTVLIRAGESTLAGALVASFSRVALVAGPLVLLTGLVSSYLHLDAVSALWQSRYGWTLLAKLAAVAVMATAGFINWRRQGPALLRDPGRIEPMRRSIRGEAAVGALVLLATAILVATAPPGSE